MQVERQLQRVGKAAQQIDGDAAHLAAIILDGEESGGRRRHHHAAAQASGGRQLLDVVRARHAHAL